jgi:tRNA G10  N-methylase Trm11
VMTLIIILTLLLSISFDYSDVYINSHGASRAADILVDMLIAILGRQPDLGIAELESIFGAQAIKPLNSQICQINAENADFERFGSIIKFAKVLTTTGASQLAVQKTIINIITAGYQPDSGAKLKLGFSGYGDFANAKQLSSMALSIKKSLKNKGFSLRIVPNKTTALGSAQVIHNKLTSPNGAEFLIIKNGPSFIIAQTVHEQDIEAYTARDQARPKRDARVGMLPPKLAQTIINLAVGGWGLVDSSLAVKNNISPSTNYQTPNPTTQRIGMDGNQQGQSDGLSLVRGSAESRSESYNKVRRASNASSDKVISQEDYRVASPARKQDNSAITLLDPFCGTGVILQEALLMGFSVYGTDIEPRMIDYSKQNLSWLVAKYPRLKQLGITLKTGDATNYKWQPMPKIIAGESFLGRPLTSLPGQAELKPNYPKRKHSAQKSIRQHLQTIAAGWPRLPGGACLAS